MGFEIKLDGLGFGKIILDGIDITRGVTGFDLHSEVNEMPVLTLRYYTHELKLEGEQIIKKVEGET